MLCDYPPDHTSPLCSSTLTDELHGHPPLCGTPLFKTLVPQPIPFRYFSFQSLPSWLTRFLARPGIEDLLDQSLTTSRQPYDLTSVSDIHESSQLGTNGQPYTSQSGNLTFGMFVDGINPYGNKQAGKHASIFFVVLACLTLPVSHRFKPENIFLVAIAPGPKEPSLTQTNWLLAPLVNDLQCLWRPGLFLTSTHRHPKGRHIHVALMPFFADLPACCRTLGLAGHSSHVHRCSKCTLTKEDINIFNLDAPKRCSQQHRKRALEARDGDFSARQRIFGTHGIRYSSLCELEYWSLTADHVVDPMHNLLLGLLAFHCRHFWKMTDTDQVEAAPPPREVLDLLEDRQRPVVPRPPTPPQANNQQTEAGAMNDTTPFLNISLLSTDPDDSDYVNPNTTPFEAPIVATVFDANLLLHVNQRLPQINIPTFISRAIPVLGQASYGSLKADNWRNLFTIQLPLCLIPLWSGKDQYTTKLLKNFAHLVSMVNLALKRTTSSDIIAKYCRHNRAYLETSLELFPDCPLVPNHHMSLHIPESLERFGPV